MPNRKATKFGRDAAGQLVDELLPDGSKKKHQYSAAGAESQYGDETEEPTVTLTDLVGRPTSRSYADGTAEIYTYEGPRLKSYTDRQKRTRSFDYDGAGRVSVVWFNNEKILRYDYDEAGRVRMITNADTQIEFANFDLDGNPRKTIQRRFKDGSGLSGAMVLDEYEQEHEWNVHGERSSWTMPRYTGFAPEGWTDKVTEGHDAAGNVNAIERTRFGSTTSEKLLDARFLEAGRPEWRTITTADGVAVRRDYIYRAADSLVTSMIVSVAGKEIAGSKNITYDGMQKASADLAGLSGDSRTSRWTYDERSRLKTTAIAREKSPIPATEVLTKADFRTALERTAETPASPKPLSFSELSGGGHKIASVTSGSDTRAFDWKGGAERVDDGNFVYEYDATGRLIKATEKPRTGTSNLSLRRVKYLYDGRERLVGRRAEYANVISAGVTPLESDWKVEDRADVIAADGIPPETTLFWDVISDNLVAVFRAGSSSGVPGGGAIDTNGGLVRQIIHGSLQYDDPLEVAVADPGVVTTGSAAVIPSVARKVGGGAARESIDATSSGITHLYPIYDESAAGSLQAVLNVNGEIVSRNFAEGAYGEDEYAVGGAAVDRVAIHATKDDQGNLASVEVTLRTTESLKSSTLAAGLRLAAVTKDGEVVRSSDAVPTLFDKNDATAVWKLTASEWNALVDPAAVTIGSKTLTPAALSIAATSELRAEAWGDVPVLAAPDWALQTKPVFTSATLPVEVREALANLSSWLSSIPAKSDRTQALHEVDDLSALGKARTFGGSGRESAGDPAQLLLGAAFHAQPFAEPITGKNYVRARWYDPATGTWLTPDPLRYRDSSNMYAFVDGDPVNRRDSLGMGEGLDRYERRAIQDKRAAERASARAALRRSGGTISAMPASSTEGAFWYAVDTATFGFFSLPGGRYDFLNEDEPSPQSASLKKFKRDFAGPVLGIEAAMALTPKGWVIKGVGLLGATLNFAHNFKQPEPVTITLEYQDGWNKRDFSRKARALEDLGERGKLYKAPNPVSRTKTLGADYKASLIKRAAEQYYKSDIAKFNELKARILNLQTDHLHDLQLFGADADVNLWLLDKAVNEGLGNQVWNQIRNLEDFTPIRILIKGMPK